MSVEDPELGFLPNNVDDRKKIRTEMPEAVDCLRRIADERMSVKGIITHIKEQYNIAPKLSRKLISAMHKGNFEDEREVHQTFEEMYELLVRNQTRQAESEEE